MRLGELQTPALVVDSGALDHNLSQMAAALPRGRLRPHVKAHKSTGLARLQAAAGHTGFTCATIRECEGLARAGLGDDLLLANEVLDARRLGRLAEAGARVTVAVDSPETIAAAVAGGVREVLVDVNVGLPRCGCAPEVAVRLAEEARRAGLEVRGVMGYEGHVVGLEDAAERAERCEEAMALLLAAHEEVGGPVISAGGTGTYALNRVATEIQAGSYLLMDTAYQRLDLGFRQAVFALARVISASAEYFVADCGLKCFGMDHGNPSIPGRSVWYCSDEHLVASPPLGVGALVLAEPAHVDPTLAYHEAVHLVDGLAEHADDPGDLEVTERIEVDLRGW